MTVQRVAPQRVGAAATVRGGALPPGYFTFAQPSTDFLSCLSASSSTQV